MPIHQLLVGFLFFTLIGFGGLLLLLRRGRRWPRIFTGTFFLVLGFLVLDVYLQLEQVYLEHPGFAYWLNLGVLLLGPIIWLLTRSTLYRDFRWQKTDALHFIPFLIALLGTITGYQMLSREEKLNWLMGLNQETAQGNFIVSVLVLAGLGVYLFFSFRHLRSYRQRLREDYAQLENKNIGWLSRLLWTFVGLLGLSLFTQVLNYLPDYGEWVLVSLLVTVVFLVVQILVSVYRGLNESALFSGILEEGVVDGKGSQDKRILAESGPIHQNALRIQAYFVSEKPYLNPELNLALLASSLGIPERELSQSINGGLGKSFFDLVNEYRIDFACALLNEPREKGETILEVMYAAGFQSKSSFNTEFRKRTGMTPSEWKRNAKL